MGWKSISLIVTLATVIAFQNCAKPPGSQPASQSGSEPVGGTSDGSKVVGTTTSYNHVVFDPNLETSVANKTQVTVSKRLEIDIDTGQMVLSVLNPSISVQCQIDVDRGQRLKSLLSISRVCEPGPLPAGVVSCLALSMADLKLSNPSRSLLLRRPLCNAGTFLCDGNDEKLRALLADLRDNPPVDCQALTQ